MEKAIAKVFGVPEGLIPELIEKSDIDLPEIDIPFFESFVAKIPAPKFKQEGVNVNENTININKENKNKMQGEQGYTLPNRSNPNYIYKFHNKLVAPGQLRSFLVEPLINVILQEDPVARPYICRLLNVYCQKVGTEYGTQYQFAYKMEKLGPPIQSLFNKYLYKAAHKDEVLEVLYKIYVPLYKTLKHLRATYKFEHQDLHINNILFVENPLDSEGKLDKTKLAVKIIDFGLSGLEYKGTTLGNNEPTPMERRTEVSQFLSIYVPEDFKAQVKEFGKDYLKVEEFVIEKGSSMVGGRRGRSRKTRKTRKMRK